MCRVLRVHQSGYYRWLSSREGHNHEGQNREGKNREGQNREGKNREGKNRLLSAQIGALFREYKGRYGSPRLQRELRDRGIIANRKRVARLMRALGLRAKSSRRFKATTNSRHRSQSIAFLSHRTCCWIVR